MHIDPIDLKTHGALLCLGLLSAALGVISLNGTLNQWAITRDREQAQYRHLAAIERDGEINRAHTSEQAKSAQHAAAHRVNRYDSVTLTNYLCDPQTPPPLNTAQFSDPNKKVLVADANQLIVGEISSRGHFTFYAHCTPEGE